MTNDSKDMQMRRELIAAISIQIKRLGSTQTELSMLTGLAQPEISNLTRKRADMFSLGRLVDFAPLFGLEVRMTATPAARD